MALFDAKLPSLKDRHREISNEEIIETTEELKKETTKVKGKVAKSKTK